MVKGRTAIAYKLPGSTSCLFSSEMLRQGQEKLDYTSQDGQHDSSHLCEQIGWNGLTNNEQPGQRPVAMVYEEGYHPHGGTPPRSPEHSSRRGITGDEGQVRLDVESKNLQQNPGAARATGSGPVCITPVNTTTQILQLETRPRSRSSECVCPGLAAPPREGLCQPPLVTDQQGTNSGASSESHNNPGGTGVENTSLVPQATGHAGGLSIEDCNPGGGNHSANTREQTSSGATTSRLEYLRQRFQNQSISKEGTELLLASWRQKSSQSYDSLFRKWVCWCNQRYSDPVSGPISEVVNFLAHLYKDGYQYRSLNSYRSAISSVHDRVDGYEVGQHPLVSRVLKGVFNSRPPQPRYESTWDVSQVLRWIEQRGDNKNLSLQDLSLKLVMLLALTRPSRSADLANLNIRYRRFLPEGVTFQPVALTKQAKQNRQRAEFFFPAFPHNANLCPVDTLKAYESRTKEFRPQTSEE